MRKWRETQYEKEKRKLFARARVLWTIFGLVLFVIFWWWWFFFRVDGWDTWPLNVRVASSVTSLEGASNATAADGRPLQSAIPNKDKLVETKLLITGDIFWGRNVTAWSQASGEGFSYPFSGLDSLDRPQYDAWIGNLECPVTTTPIDFSIQADTLKFNCPLGYLEEAKKWFTAFSLANNHTDNQEEIGGFAETQKHLEAAGVQYFGHHKNNINEICDVITVTGRTIRRNTSDVIENVQVPLSFCGTHGLFRVPNIAQEAAIEPYAEVLPTFVMPHMGEEYVAEADAIKTKHFKNLVDHGADGVFGGHPHWVQNTEAYKGKMLAYSLGNFIFDQQWDDELMRSASIEMRIVFDYDENLQGWIDIAENCKAHGDNCLNEGAAKNLQKPTFNISYDLVAAENTSQVTQRADKVELDKLLFRTNWQETLDALSTE